MAFKWYGKRFTQKLKAHLEDGLEGAADTVRRYAQEFAPVLTGRLKASMATERVESLHWRIGSTIQPKKKPHAYPFFQEYGFKHWKTGKFIQNPFLRPALDKSRTWIRTFVCRPMP